MFSPTCNLADKVLEDDADPLAKRFHRPFLKICSVQQNLALGRFIKSSHQLNQGGFARAIFPDQGQ